MPCIGCAASKALRPCIFDSSNWFPLNRTTSWPHFIKTRFHQGRRHLQFFSTTQQNDRISITQDGKERGDELQRRDVVKNEEDQKDAMHEVGVEKKN